MIIANITDRAGNAPKVVGIGKYWLMPGEEKEVPDNVAMVNETDRFGNPTGNKILLPSVAVQVKLGMLAIKEDKPAKKQKAVEEPVEAEEPVEEAEEDDAARKKAEAAAKRAATRAANKAAKEAAAKATE